jgi:hypothetical protein
MDRHPGGGFTDELASLLIPVSYLFALLLLVAAVVMTSLGRLWVAQLGDLSSVGLASICALYILSAHRFRTLGATPAVSMVLAVLFANVFLQSYEIVYGLSFLPSVSGGELRTILLLLVMVSPVVLVRDYLRFDMRTSLPLILLFGVVWFAWILFGFPQYYLNVYPYPPVLKTDDPFHLSLWFNFSSKAIFAAFFASLLEPHKAVRKLLEKVTRSR